MSEELLARQLSSALDADACFCIQCGQPDEPELHDRTRCITPDPLSVAGAVEVYDHSCELLPDLDHEARALHCAMLSFASSAAGQREGWKLVPVEPTEEMWDAFDRYNGDKRTGYNTWLAAWSAMLAASPSAPEERRDEVEMEERGYRLGWLRAKHPEGWDEQDDTTVGNPVFTEQMRDDLECGYPREKAIEITALEWFATCQELSLLFDPMLGCWQVRMLTGVPQNWVHRTIGSGDTPLEAILAAGDYMTPKPSKPESGTEFSLGHTDEAGTCRPPSGAATIAQPDAEQQ